MGRGLAKRESQSKTTLRKGGNSKKITHTERPTGTGKDEWSFDISVARGVQRKEYDDEAEKDGQRENKDAL